MPSVLPAVLMCVVAAVSVMTVAACAHAAVVERRVLVKVSAPGDPAAVAAQAGRSAGVPVRYVAAASEVWHALALECRPTDCDAAVQRLVADRAHFESVQSDERKRGSNPD